MKALVTGGCGFIGSHLVERLIAAGHEVTVLDNLSTGKKENLNRAAKLVRGDIMNPADVKKAAKDCKVVFHLAAIADSGAADDRVYKTNFLGAKNVFQRAENIKAKVIFSSSAAVYGDGKVPCSEAAQCKPVSQYGKSKLKAENILKKQGNYFILRLFNVYGPGGRGAVNKFCERLVQGKDITVFGNGLQTRDFIFVSDVVDAILLGIDSSGVYNVGTGKETSIFQLIDTIEAVYGSKPEVKFSLPKKDEIKRSAADTAGIKKLGWKPTVQLKEGVAITLRSLAPQNSSSRT